ncbi:MAG TPA: hypothetical protein VLU41_13970 [Ideonella sp.]|nr:hypothetical protein [Ideonella sp.]
MGPFAEGSAGLWAAVLAFGVYHGLNPAMGWPLAVANGLTARRDRAVFATLGPLGAGHFLAMAVVLVPFALMVWLLQWSLAIRLAAGALLIAFGVWRLLERRHPRALARVPPTRLAWWSFLMATAHGAGLMLLPVALGLCGPRDEHASLLASLAPSVGTALLVAAVHTLAMIVAGVALAWAVYRWLGLAFVRRAWLNLDAVWGGSLVLVGITSCLVAWLAS